MRRTRIYLYVLIGVIMLYWYKLNQWRKIEKEYQDCMKKYEAK
tara:strand:- start:173 stop:301 length:129 start_codon:yes stop_codon:yes gene_type:complete